MSEDKKYYIPDIETGFKIEVSKDVWEKYIEGWESCKPKLNSKGVGTIMIFGTAGDMEVGEDLKKMFMENKRYAVIDLDILKSKLFPVKHSPAGIGYQEAIRWVIEQTESIAPHIEEAFKDGCHSMKIHSGAWGDYSKWTNEDLQEFKKGNGYA